MYSMGLESRRRAEPGASPDASAAPRRAYEPPRLTRVGTLRDLLAGATGSADDGGGTFTPEIGE
jgi:hypothetical protein